MNRAGVVLVLVLIAVVALELLAMSAFGFARVAQLGALMAGSDAALQGAASDAVEQAAAGIDVRAAAARPVGTAWNAAVIASPGILATAGLRRLDGGFVLVTARARHAGGGGERQAAALVRIIEPTAILAAFPAVLTVFGVAGAELAVTSPPQAGCASDAGLPSTGLTPTGLPLIAHRTYPDSLPFGAAVGAGWPDVMRIADRHIVPGDGRVLPTDARAPSADTATTQAALIALDGPVTLSDTITGAIAVDGDLVLVSGALVRGLLTVHGTLTLEDGARIDGAARATAFASDGGRIVYDRCAIEAALDAPAFRRVYRQGRWRLPAF